MRTAPLAFVVGLACLVSPGCKDNTARQRQCSAALDALNVPFPEVVPPDDATARDKQLALVTKALANWDIVKASVSDPVTRTDAHEAVKDLTARKPLLASVTFLAPKLERGKEYNIPPEQVKALNDNAGNFGMDYTRLKIKCEKNR